MKTLLLLACSLAITGCATPMHQRYVCGCGDGCTNCKTTSDQPGKCACGKPLVLR